ncbi:hypothetical protein Q7P37_004791 [Cladosporium fusiforme]
MTDRIDLKKPHRPLRVGVILLDSRTEIMDIAPIDLIAAPTKENMEFMPEYLITDQMRTQTMDIETHWVTESGKDAQLTAGATVKATHSFETCPPLDIVLMGAHHMGYTLTEGEVNFIRKTHEHCAAFLFVCGSFMAGLQAGLLQGKTATGPRPMIEHLRQSNPEVNWVTKRWARDGKIWTSGALLNGTDMVKAFAEETWGGEEEDLFGMILRLGGYPYRDINYADVPWKL